MKNQERNLPYFMWHDLCTQDGEKAERFYCNAFGWGLHREKIADGKHLAMFTHNHVPFAAVVTEDVSLYPGLSGWMNYINIRKDIHKYEKDVCDGGGKILREAFNMPGMGMISLVSDPWGAPFFLCELAEDKPHTPSPIVWQELSSNGPVEEVIDFYKTAFSWESQAGTIPNYHLLTNNGIPFAGIFDARPSNADANNQDKIPHTWFITVNTESADHQSKKIIELGGAQIMPPTTIAASGIRYAGFLDPSNHAVWICETLE